MRLPIKGDVAMEQVTAGDRALNQKPTLGSGLPQLPDSLPHGFAVLQVSNGGDAGLSHHTIHAINSAFARMLGVQPTAAVGRSFRQVLPEPEHTSLLDSLDAVVLGGAGSHAELTCQIGDMICAADIFRVEPEEVGIVLQDVTLFRSATETAERLIAELKASQQRTESLAAELQRANATLQTLIDTMPTGVVACDTTGRITLANPAIDELVGGDIGRRLFEETRRDAAHQTDDSRSLPAQFPLSRALVEGKTVRDVEMEIQGQDGTSRVLLVSASPVLDANGDLIGGVAVARDITGRKMAEVSLRENEERFRLLYERAPLGYQSLDEAGCLIDVNQTWLEALGYERDEVVGRPLGDFLVPEQEASFGEVFARLKETGESRDAEFEMVRRDSTRLIVSFIGRVSYDEQGRFRQAHCILNDVTEQKRLEEQLLRASRLEMAGRIAGQVAHDLNNLLAPLVAYPELMRMQLPPEHHFQDYCETMLRSAQQISTISTNLLALGRRGHSTQETLDLNQLVRQALDQMTDRPDSLTVVGDLSDDLLPVVGSSAQLVRVIVNLVANAREAMGDDGRLTLRTRNLYLDRPFGRHSRIAVGEYVRLDVADTGPGIPPEILSRIFEPFFSSKRADDQRGSGLGLSIVESVVADHRGYVDLETRSGEGTTFSLYFPAARGAVLAVEADLVGGNGESVLIVDDDATQREVIGRLLRQLNYRVSVAARPDEALAMLRAEPVDLLVLDMVMPGIDGAETYRRALALRPDTRAILVSGFAESRRVRIARELGAYDFIQKPLTLGRLARAVRAALDAQGTPRDNNGV